MITLKKKAGDIFTEDFTAKILSRSFISFSGPILGNEVFPKISSLGSEITLDVSKVTYINSPGTRNWIKWIKSEVDKSYQKKIRFVGLHSSLIMSVNTMNHFLPVNSTIDSFYCPLYNESLDLEMDILLIEGVHFTYPISDYNEINFESLLPSGYELDVSDHYFRFLFNKRVSAA